MLNSIRENEGDNAATTTTPTIESTATYNTTNSIVSTATVLAELDMPSPITDDRIEMMNIVVVIDTLPMYIPT